MTTRTSQSSATGRTNCPFCNRSFSRLGSHLPHCSARNGADYTCYLSQKTLNKKSKTVKKACPKCGRKFARLDTHLRRNAKCKLPVLPSPSPDDRPCSPQEDRGMPQGAVGVEAGIPDSALSERSNISTEMVPTASVEASSFPSCTQSPTWNSPRFKLPQTQEEWREADEVLSRSVVPAVLSCTTIEEKIRHYVTAYTIISHRNLVLNN